MAAAPAAPQKALPLFDLFLDLPHPGCSAGHRPPILVKGEQEEDLGQQIGQIASFAFPEYEQSRQSPPRPPVDGAPLINRHSHYAMQAPGFQQFTFTLQLQSGSRVHGHVRRYLPNGAAGRYDVGRRPERALVILTRVSGADLLFAAILKSMEAISAQETTLTAKQLPVRSGDVPNSHWFLRALASYHQHLAHAYMSKPIDERGKPLVAALEGLEIGNTPLFNKIDVTRFVMPTAMLQPPTCAFAPVTFTTSMLPLLRCVGVAHTLRLVSALLSERRIVLVSASPARLTSCSHAALAILAQGMLYWQHLYIPVLPPHLWQYLAAPYPYLIGILTDCAPRLDRTEGLGEVLVLNLDRNSMETRNIDQRVVADRLPDLFVSQQRDFVQEKVMALPDYLASDLQDVLKMDKRVVYGGETINLQNVSATAVKAGRLAKKTLTRLAGKTNKFLNKGVNIALKREGSQVEESLVEEEENGAVEEPDPSLERSMDASYIYMESCHIELCEEEARLAFAMFFVCVFGNMRWYLSTPAGQHVPQFDGNHFLQERRRLGDGEGSAMWPLLKNFTQSQMFHEFAKARIDEIRTGKPVAPDMPLFLQCCAIHRKQQLDFSPPTVRQTCAQIAQTSPQRVTGQLQSTARQNAMLLTSNKTFEGDYSGTIAQLVEQCRECTLVLFDVMSVCWLRLQDCRGLNWKHAYHALQILRNLLYHGPMAAVTEATDGLDKIRALKYYENMRPANAQQVRLAATAVYDLLVDRTKLFNARRFCINRRRELANPRPRAVRDQRFNPTVPFRNLHAAANPVNQMGTRVAIPPAAPSQLQMERETQPTADLLGSYSDAKVSSQNLSPHADKGTQPTEDLLGSYGAPSGPTSHTAVVAQNSFDLAGPFSGMSVSVDTSSPAPAASNPFDLYASSSQEPQKPDQQPSMENHSTLQMPPRPNQPVPFISQPNAGGPMNPQAPFVHQPPQQCQVPQSQPSATSNNEQAARISAPSLMPTGAPHPQVVPGQQSVNYGHVQQQMYQPSGYPSMQQGQRPPNVAPPPQWQQQMQPMGPVQAPAAASQQNAMPQHPRQPVNVMGQQQQSQQQPGPALWHQNHMGTTNPQAYAYAQQPIQNPAYTQVPGGAMTPQQLPQAPPNWNQFDPFAQNK